MDFSPQQKYNLLTQMGYSGSTQSDEMDAFVQSNPGVAARMGKFSRVMQKRMGMATGGTASDTLPATDNTVPPPTEPSPGTELAQAAVNDPSSLVKKTDVAKVEATPDTLIAEGTGQMNKKITADTTTVDTVATATAPQAKPAATVTAETSAGQVQAATDANKAVTGAVSPEALVTAEQQTTSSIEGMKAAQGEAILMQNPVQRQIQEGEMISGSAVDAAKVNEVVSSIQAAEATPSTQATVQGQMESLMQDFEGGATPAWAAGAMRSASATMAARGLGASSLAGQAVVQAAMEAALPIAQADAATIAQFEAMNLSNRQQAAMLAAEQRAAFLGQEFDQEFQTRVANAAKVSDIANMNFTAEQNIALENSRIVNTMNLANLSNDQAMVMAQAAALSNLDIANLNNRQQAAVQNANSFLQMDMTNLNNQQQTAMFNAQANINAILTDTAAVNAAAQFNATSENQTNQFYDSLTATISQFNAGQQNAIAQFNAGEVNAMEKWNTQLEQQRQQFNATNSLVVAQANAVWRQNISTINTAAENAANMEMAKTENGLTMSAMDEIWQKERDALAFSFTAMQNDADRAIELTLQDKKAESEKYAAESAENAAMVTALTKLAFGW